MYTPTADPCQEKLDKESKQNESEEKQNKTKISNGNSFLFILSKSHKCRTHRHGHGFYIYLPVIKNGKARVGHFLISAKTSDHNINMSHMTTS